MKVVLNQDVKGLGKKLQIVEVSEGYARNFLLPKKLASVADGKNINEAKGKIDSQKFKKKTETEEANKNKEILEKGFIEFRHKVGEGSRLYGSVTEKDIAQAIKDKFNIDVEYIYLLDNWFRNERYADVLDYIHSVGCDYYFEYIPLTRLGLPVPPELVED